MGIDGDTDTSKCMAEVQHAGTEEMKEAVASFAGDRARDELNNKEEIRHPWEEGGKILRLKKEMMAAWELYFLTRSSRGKGRDEATQEKAGQGMKETQETAQAPAAGKKRKRKKVVKIKLRQDYVDSMAAHPFSICADLSEENLAKRTPGFREFYAAAKFLQDKNREYWNALIAQRDELGYAEDVNEVTDDEEDEEVKN